MKKLLVLALILPLALWAFPGPAQAGDNGTDLLAGMVIGLGAGLLFSSPVVVQAPPPVVYYYFPPPVVYQAPPVVYHVPTVVYQSPPIVYRYQSPPQVVYYGYGQKYSKKKFKHYKYDDD